MILTKPLGTGVITTALKNQQADEAHITTAVASMSRLNRTAAQLAQQGGVHAMTDVTGYSLIGHSREMALAGEVDFHINYDSLEWLPGAMEYAQRGIFPGGTERNRDHFSQWAKIDNRLGMAEQGLLFDPQTSGGLLISIEAERAEWLVEQLVAAGDDPAIIGDVHLGNGAITVSV